MLRHTFATMCIEGGFEIKCLSEILGHSGSQITLDRYVHSSFDLKKVGLTSFQIKTFLVTKYGHSQKVL